MLNDRLGRKETNPSDKASVHSMISQGATNITLKPFNVARVLETIERPQGPRR